MKGPAAVLAVGLLLLAGTGCEEDPPTSRPLVNNEISREWHGVYEGIGAYTSRLHGIDEKRVSLVVRIQDVGGNRVQVELHIANEDTYAPKMRIEMPVDSLFHNNYSEQIDGRTYYVSLSRSASIAKLSSSMWVKGAGQTVAAWECGISAYRIDNLP